MKIFKELIPFLYQKTILYSVPTRKLKLPDSKKEIPIAVSLTTIPSRIKLVHLTVRSLLMQEARPKKISLWIHQSLKTHIPPELKKLEGEVFEICYSQIDCPHLKLLEGLNRDRKLPIVTVDDDQIYSKNLLRALFKSHLENPDCIISTIARQITFDESKNPLPYQQWPYVHKLNFENRFLLPLGVFGVLYPPDCFNAEVTNIDLIKELSPKADDLWFKALSTIKGTKVKIIGEKINPPTMVLGTQEISLKNHNVSQDNNRIQWKKLMDYFKIEV